MKISAKKKGQIYDLVHLALMGLRIEIHHNYLSDNPIGNKVDFKIAQVEVPLAQEIIDLIVEGKSKEA